MLPQLPINFSANFPYKTLLLSLIVTIICFTCDLVYANPLYHHLNGDIDAYNVAPIIKSLNRAKPTDTLVIMIHSRGGEIHSGLDLINAMRESKARAIVVRVHEYALSIAALVALEADKIILDPNAELDFNIINDTLSRKYITKNTIYQRDNHLSTWFRTIVEQKTVIEIPETRLLAIV